jgi:membrane-associated protein
MADAFQTFIDQYAQYGYPILFAGVLLENAGIPVPGETAVLVAGFLSSPAGGARFHIYWVVLVTVLAAVIGDNVGFWLGHRYARPRLREGRGFLFLTPKTLRLSEGYFERYGTWTVFFARFITGLRVVGALAAGTSGMSWPRFLLANAGGAVAWAVTMSLLGYFFGHSWELLHRWLGRGGLVILGSVVLLIALPHLMHHLRKLPGLRIERLTRAQLWQGGLVAVLEVLCLALLVLMGQGRHETGLDTRVDEWVESHDFPPLDALARAGSVMGSLPVLAGATALGLLWLWRRRRAWQEWAVLLWALIASELLGLLFVGVLHVRDVKPVVAEVWPYGFSGLVPLRAFAVYGMMAYLLRRQSRASGVGAGVAAVLLIAWAGFSVVWNGEQLLTETLLELAAGGLVVFAGAWWLEGLGPGLYGPSSR